MNSRACLFLTLSLLFSGSLHCLNAAKYYVVPLGELDFAEDATQALGKSVSRVARNTHQIIHYPGIRLDGASSEGYIGLPEPDNENTGLWGSEVQSELLVALKLPDAAVVSGKASLVNFSPDPRKVYSFAFDPGQREEATEAEFQEVRKSYYARLASSRIPGGDWFRYRAGDAYKSSEQDQRWRNLGQFDSSFNMFTGQRAVSENLALDRELILGTKSDGAPVKIDTIKGVTVEAIDWSSRITDAPTAIDPLAMVIPHDQHAAFFGSIKELNEAIRMMEDEGVRYIQNMSNRKTYSGLAKKYQKQMGILIPDILDEQLPVKSLAITGGDPFFPSGTDLCVIFETGKPEALLATLKAMVEAQAKASGTDLTSQSTPVQNPVHSYHNIDSSFSSYIFAGKNFVAVSNHPRQVELIRATINDKSPSLGSLEEFKFFRQRYPLAEEATGFIFLSDATIRRWAGPAFRIGASRRVRAAAAIGQATAQLIDGVGPQTTYANLVGELTVHNGSIRSEIFNTLEFLTPIDALDIETVTPSEKDGYERWRRGYENGWVVFDPIALSLKISEESADLDLSVIPLRLNSDYDTWIETAGDATLDKQAMTPHPESIFMVSHAFDTESQNFRMLNTTGSSMLPGIGANPFAWVGGSLSVFADQDPFWEAMQNSEDAEDYIEDKFHLLPVGLRVSSKSPIKLALFLTTLRSFSEQAAPGLLVWETLEHEETPYVVIRTTDKAGLPNDMELKIHYAAMPSAFILSLNEAVLKRAISRNLKQAAAPEAPEESGEQAREASPYQVFAQAKVAALHTYIGLFEGGVSDEIEQESWAALPILNELKRIFPDKDPVKVHQHYFKESLDCPGGKGYRWNEQLGSMESVVFGHPQARVDAEIDLMILKGWDAAKAAIGLKDKEFRLEAKLSK